MSVPAFLESRLAELGGDVTALARWLATDAKLGGGGWHPRNVERVLGVAVASDNKDLADGVSRTSSPEGAERKRNCGDVVEKSSASPPGEAAISQAAHAPASRRGDRTNAIAAAPPRERPSRTRLLGPIRKPEPQPSPNFDDDDEVDPHADTVPPSAPVVDLDERRRTLRRANEDVPSREALRSRRAWSTPARTEATHRMSKRRLQLLGAGLDYEGGRPATRGDCVGGARPCPYVSCRHHLLLDVAPNDHIKINFPHVFGLDDEPDLELMVDTCALDVADRDGVTLQQVAELMNITRERVRQIEAKALEKVRRSRSRLQDEAVALSECAR